MRVVFFGTPDCAVGYLDAIEKAGGEIVAVVTQPDRQRGRGRTLCPPPVKEAALCRGFTCLQAESCRESDFVEKIRSQEPDIMLVVAFGELICNELLDVPRVAAMNVHYSLLPALRGAAPVQHALLQGLEKTGVTLQHLDEKLDAGDIVASRELAVKDTDDTATLTCRLTELGCDLVREYLPHIIEGTAPRRPQDLSQSSWAPSLRKADGQIDWNRPAREVVNHIRAMNPWPGAFCRVKGKRLIIREAFIDEKLIQEGQPGSIIELPVNRGPVVRAGEGGVELVRVQPEGKKSMSGAEFLRGTPLQETDCFC